MLESQPTQPAFYQVNGHTVYGIPPRPCGLLDICASCEATR